ncbi:MAG: GGDEF domain-containing protein [Wenzhouxiangella sp.]|nr:MAG: GGDEF domain-containing protein [Wenzhouxiangella sp.]
MIIRRCLVCLLSFVLIDGVAADPDLRGLLDEAQRVSYQEHWQQAQVLLDEVAARMDRASLREYADFHLLEARHLALADRSEEALQRAAELLELDLAEDQRLRALQFSANIGVLLRQYERAFEYLGRALAIRVELEDPAPRIATFNMASYMFGRVGEYERGIRYGERAVVLARDVAGPAELCVALQRLAPVYKWAGQLERSEQAYRDGIATCREVGNALFVGVLRHGLADLLRQQERLEEAMDLAERAIAGLEQAVYPLGEHEARLVRAETLHDLGRLGAAEQDELLRLSGYFGARELWDQAARLEALLSRMAEADGEPARALQHLHRLMQARESFLGRERAMRLAYLQVEFDTRFQQQEIELLRESTRVAQLEAETAAQQRRVRALGMLLVGLVFLALVWMLLRVFRSRRRFRDLSRQDQLSGLANHGWFFERAQALLDEYLARPSSGLVVLVAADIDHFKDINDRFGHRVGDEVLGRTARRMRESFPEHALIGRIGGEEFAALVRVDRIDQVIDCIERFRRPDPDSVRAGDPEVTASFGLSCYRPGDDIDALRERADRTLYRAKQSGRDCYRLDASCPAAS